MYRYLIRIIKQSYIYSLSLISFSLLISCSNPEIIEVEEEVETFGSLAEEMVSRINTDVNPDFVYDFENTKFVPPAGKTLLIMGQTLEDIDDYMANFSEQPIPGGWSAYWGVPAFQGITDTHTNPNGSSHNHQQLAERFPNTAIQSGMWMVGKDNVARNTANGAYDDVIIQYSDWAKSVNHPIYLRIGYEFDGAHNELEPSVYIRAYRRIVDLMRAEGVDNVAFVWHSYASRPYKDYPVSEWYPGDEYVDWVGISVFGQIYQSADIQFFGNTVMEFAKTKKKPVMIAESSPILGIEPINLDSWNRWFVNFFSFSYSHNIKAISFINTNWESYDFSDIGVTTWKDARLANNQFISNAWFLETNQDRYLKQSENLFEMLGYEPDE